MITKDSPVEQKRKEMPRGNGNWDGFDRCYGLLKIAAQHLAKNQYTRIGEDHVNVMAAMGSGHEQTMRCYVKLAYTCNWI